MRGGTERASGACSSTPILRERAKPPHVVNSNNSGIIRALFDETLSPLESGDSGSEESADELEQIGAESVSVAAVHNTLPRTTTAQSFPAFPITSVDESDEGHVDDPGKVNESRSETEAERSVAAKRRCRSPCRHQTPSPTPSSSTHSSPTPSSSTPSSPKSPSSAFTASHPSPPRVRGHEDASLGSAWYQGWPTWCWCPSWRS